MTGVSGGSEGNKRECLRLAYDMDAFLKWVCQYGLKALHQKLENNDTVRRRS